MKTTGYILNGIYYEELPPAQATVREATSALYKQHDHDRQREEHRRDLIQPYKNGQPNPEFIQEYPTLAQEYGFI